MTTQLSARNKFGSKARSLVGLAAAGIVTGMSQVSLALASPGDDENMGGHMFDWLGRYGGYVLFIGLLWIFIAFAVSQDAYSRGENGLLWGLIVLFMPMMGLFVYLIFLAIRSSGASRAVTTTVTPQAPAPTQPAQPAQTQYIAPQPVAPQPQTTPKTGDVQYCTACGAANSLTAKFCNSCGAPLKA